MRFHYRSTLPAGKGDYEPPQEGVEYAVVYFPRPSRQHAPMPQPLRPVLYVRKMGLDFIFDPDANSDEIQYLPDDPRVEPLIVGLWDGQKTPEVTWRQYASHQYGQVLRQRALAERLTDFGIPRKPETYLPHRNTCNQVERSSFLNFDEIDKLLTAAGF